MSKAKELQKIIDDSREALAKTSDGVSAFNPVTIAHRQAEIYVAASQLAEISTRRITRLTWALIALTAALLFFTAALYKDTHFQVERNKATNCATQK